MATRTSLKATMVTLLFVLVVGAPAAAGGQIIYVDDDATGANDGSSWENAYNYLQDALADASSTLKSVEIRVAEGIYTPDSDSANPNGSGDREATFQLINGVTLKGGYAGFGEPEPNARDINVYVTALSGDLDGNDVEVNDPCDLLTELSRAENSYHVVTGSNMDSNAILDGFSITGGNANVPWPDDWGGGMLNYDYSSPMLIGCTFAENSARNGGGGMRNHDYSSPILINCTFTGNTARGGGGMNNTIYSNPILTGCTFSENTADWGGGMDNYMSSPTLTECNFRNNSATGGGGGMGNYKSSPTLTECNFRNNSATVDGGGMINWNSILSLTNCTFIGNSATSWGGGILNRESSMAVTNCILIANLAGEVGGGIWNYNDCKLMLTKCTVVANSAPNGKALACDSDYKMPSRVNVNNCILWDGGNEIWNEDRSTITVTYSDVWGGWPGDGNIDANPCFFELGYWDPNGLWIDGDYHLQPGSPCIDAGDPDYIAEPNETDLDGNPRLIDCRIDMGAYEYMPSIPAEVRITPSTINLAIKSEWITCYIRLPEAYNLGDIESNSVFLDDSVQAESLLVDEQKQVATARFSRQEVQSILDIGKVELKIDGWLKDGNGFQGTDVITVIHKGGGVSSKHQASEPNPPDGATGVDIYVNLSWTAGYAAISHDVYFGTSGDPPFVCNQNATTFDPGTLTSYTTYYWRIDEVNKWTITTGQIWSFTPYPPPPPP